MLSGLVHSGRSEGLNGHEHCAYLHLTGAPLVKRDRGKRLAGLSVDQAAARAMGDRTLFSSLEFGLTNHETMYSWRGPGASVPYESNPRLVFERMFRGRKPIVPNWHRRHAVEAAAVQKRAKLDSYDQSVLDLVLEDAKDLRGKLGQGDQRKLDEYLNSVRAIETRVQFVESRLRIELLDAKNPGPSKVNLPGELPPDGGAYWKFFNAIHRDPEKHAEYIRLMADLLVLAFQTDTTRVATVAIGSDEALFPGVVTVGYERHCHTLEHRGNAGRPEEADPIAREGLRQVHAWYTKLVAEMAAKMQKIDEGGSRLLDNSLLLFTSYMSDGGHGTQRLPGGGAAGGQGGRQAEDLPAPGLQGSHADGEPVRGDAEFDGRQDGAVRRQPHGGEAGVRRQAAGAGVTFFRLPCRALLVEPPLMPALPRIRGLFVAGSARTASRMSSTDGIAWKQLQTGKDGEVYRAVCFGNNRFVALGTYGGDNLFSTTTDGATWQTATRKCPTAATSAASDWGKDPFLAVGGDAGFGNYAQPCGTTSVDGVKWGDFFRFPGKSILRRVAFGDGKFVGVGDLGTPRLSPWTARNGPTRPTSRLSIPWWTSLSARASSSGWGCTDCA